MGELFLLDIPTVEFVNNEQVCNEIRHIVIS
jgi:hypothetical protein